MNAITNISAGTELLWFGNNLLSIPVSCDDGEDRMSVIEQWSPYGDSPPMHVHKTEDEVFVVLAGRVKVVIDGTSCELTAGDRALAPKGIAHTYRVESPEGAHFLAITTGRDFETMVRKCARPAGHAGLPTPVAPSPEMIAALTQACAESRITFVGPPLG